MAFSLRTVIKRLEVRKILLPTTTTTYSNHKNTCARYYGRLTTTTTGTSDEKDEGERSRKGDRNTNKIYALLSFGGVASVYYALTHKKIHTEEAKSDNSNDNCKLWHKTERKNLPTYQLDEIRKHDSLERGVWVSLGRGVYDITNFISKHPGSDKIMMGAGSAIEPFWELYQQHYTEEILKLLEKYRIGNISAEDEVGNENMESLWAHEPQRHKLLKATSQQPFNAEPPVSLLSESFYTPNDFFYVRNHLPVPVIDEQTFVLDIELETEKAAGEVKQKTLSLADIKKLPRHSVTAAVMCGGNRRSEMAVIKPIKGLSWSAGAVGNAKWTGVRLRDILLEMGVKDSSENLHVIFEGADLDASSHPYGASIPLSQAMDPRADILLAYEMNEHPLSRDHGFPLRAIIPGTVGARNVKWLTRVAIAEHESTSHWQQNDYKGFSPSTDWDTVDFSKAPAIQAMPVTSAICSPAAGDVVKVKNDGYVTARGYAWSGGGRRIVRVDISADCGKNWYVAELEQDDLPDGRHYGWSLWTARIPVDKKNNGKNIELWAKAVDSSYNVQPESFHNIWNLRGVLANAYHRVKIQLDFNLEQ